jgi:hypothetical protein
VCEMGGSGTIEQSLKCVKQGGLVSAIGILTESKMSDILPEIVFGGKTCELTPSTFSMLS